MRAHLGGESSKNPLYLPVAEPWFLNATTGPGAPWPESPPAAKTKSCAKLLDRAATKGNFLPPASRLTLLRGRRGVHVVALPRRFATGLWLLNLLFMGLCSGLFVLRVVEFVGSLSGFS